MKESNEFLQNILGEITILLPKLLLAIVIILIGFLLGRLVQKLVKQFIIYLNNSLNEWLQNTMLNVDLKSSATFISKVFFWFILLISFFTCVKVLELHFVSVLFDSMIRYLPNVLIAVIIIFFGIIFGRLLGDLVKSAALKTGVANGNFLGKGIRFFIMFIALDIAVGQLGVDLAFLNNIFIIIVSFILFGASLAFGLGARTSVSNILGSFYVRKSFKLGTKVMLNDVEGTIVKVSDHAITLETKSGSLVIPAKDFSESRIKVIKEG